jgi:predicted kinase
VARDGRQHGVVTVGGVTGGLVVFCGLPGVGKSSVSRRVADRLGATYLRIDTIEAAIVSTLIPFEGNPVGYVVAGRVAADQLRAGRSVVADAVNGVTDARRGWESVAQECGVPIRFVVVTCSDPAEHRRRVESRTAEMPGHGVPTWEQVLHRRWDPLLDSHLVIDNLGDIETHVTEVLAWLTRLDDESPDA